MLPTNSVLEFAPPPIPIRLFGHDLLLYRRSAGDCYKLEGYSKSYEGDALSANLICVVAIVDSLKYNYLNIPWYKPKRYKLKRLLSKKSIIKNLDPQSIFDLSSVLNEHEFKKKAVTDQADQ